MERMTVDTEWVHLMEHLGPELWDLYKSYLEASDSEVRMDYNIFADDPTYSDAIEDNELWDIPDGFQELISMDNVLIPGMSIGWVAFGNYKGKKLIMECNASPYQVYWKE